MHHVWLLPRAPPAELDEYGYHPVGFFSKEKYSEIGYNLGEREATPALETLIC